MSKPTGRTPLYKQIQQYVLDEIYCNDWGANHKLPSESELANRFHVSRLTVKYALKELMDNGLIYRIQGKGTFLSPDYSGKPVVYECAENPKKLIAYLMPLAKTIRSMNLINGIEDQLVRHGYRLLYCKTHDSRETEKQIIQEVIRLGVAGIIIYPVEGETYSEEVLQLTLNHFPLVLVDRFLRGVETNCVIADNVKGARDAVNHLIGLGHSKIGFVSTCNKGTSSIEERLAGYERALADHNQPIEHRLRKMNFAMERVNAIWQHGECDEEINEEMQAFIAQNPDMTALLAANAALGYSAIQAAEKLGLRVPDDLSVVFFDDYELSSFSRIPPTCIHQQEYVLGKEAAELVVSIVENRLQERRKIVVPTKLIVRQSTGRPRKKFSSVSGGLEHEKI
jgi:GntR family transcriptional regulator of arabinose operon